MSTLGYFLTVHGVICCRDGGALGEAMKILLRSERVVIPGAVLGKTCSWAWPASGRFVSGKGDRWLCHRTSQEAFAGVWNALPGLFLGSCTPLPNPMLFLGRKIQQTWIRTALLMCRFCVCRFSQAQMEKIKKKICICTEHVQTLACQYSLDSAVRQLLMEHLCRIMYYKSLTDDFRYMEKLGVVVHAWNPST